MPAGKRHVLAAKQILTDTTHLYGDDPYSAHDDSLFADEVHEQQVQPSINNVNKHNSDPNNTINNTNKANSSTHDNDDDISKDDATHAKHTT